MRQIMVPFTSPDWDAWNLFTDKSEEIAQKMSGMY